MLRIATCLGLALLVGSCRNQTTSSQQSALNESRNAKPVVAVVPIIDNSKNDLSWNLSDELTAFISRRLYQKNKLSLVDQDKIRAVTSHLKESDNPFAVDLSWVKKAFAQNEFVVFMELIEHEEVAIPQEKKSILVDASAELNMSLRIRVVDLRGEKPQVVLQELLHDSHKIPRAFTKENFYQVSWHDDSFIISPMGMAHDQFTKQIAERIQDYILIAERR
jgi:hypothetical protein